MKDPYLQKLRCAYTGNPVKVHMTGTDAARQLYFVEGAYDPGVWHPDSKSIMKALGTRDGIMGLARNGAEFICPYTGVRMAIERKAGIVYRAVGGYRPTVPVTDPFLLARNMMTRGGKAPADAPKPAVVTATERVDNTPEDVSGFKVSDDEALAAAEYIVKDDLPLKTMITVPEIAPKE
jgi:hypothetical protein